jgi:hypothetical protein
LENGKRGFKVIDFISTLSDAGIFVGSVIVLGLPMIAGFLLGKEIGLDQGHRAGFDLGKAVGKREAANSQR